MINLNITFALKPDQTPELNASFVSAFIRALEEKGHSVNGIETPSPTRVPRVSASSGDKGPNELALLEKRGLQRMKVPASWTGTREDYAAHCLKDENPDVDEETTDNSDDVYGVLHE